MADDQPFEIDLTDMANGGSALGRNEDQVVFVPFAIPGERVRVQTVEQKRRVAWAQLIDVIEAAPERSEPACAHFGPGLCAVCHWQHIDYAAQLRYKQAVVQDQLERIGKLKRPQVSPIVPAPTPWGYRTSLTFELLRDGSYALPSNIPDRWMPIEMCPILRPELLDLLAQFDLNSDEVTRVKVMIGTDPDDRMLIIETVDDLAPEIEVDFPVSINLLLSDNEPVNLIGSPQVHYNILDRQFRVTAGSFFRPNPALIGEMVKSILERLGLEGDETILDLYSGVGVFSAFLAEWCSLVISVESYPPAVTDADHNTADIDNIDLLEGAVEVIAPDVEEDIDIVVVDPPGSGLSHEARDILGEIAAPLLIYISSDVASLARDIQSLGGHGYRLVDVQPFDLLPQSYHVECIAFLEYEG
ncbi:MAG: class I SAM-dependent RNA methyltransferase [Chloroflexi bacterium]|nr:class I SAM-dependent RNA methyltransferase [Chloroflexota bacterium]